MKNARLCLGLSDTFSFPFEDQIRILKKVGFDGFFYNWGNLEEARALRRTADEEDMIFQSVHAPFAKIDRLWNETEETPAVIREQLDCLHGCAEVGVPIMIVHTFIGFDGHTPAENGYGNFAQIVREAEKLGVKIAFENTEGEEYLAALMAYFKDSPAVGFCWDTGHEMCYNAGRDMIALYGDRLIATHLNDNLGISDYNGNITWVDDLHLLPFDGIGDWTDIAARLNRCNYNGILTFELNRANKPGRLDNEMYVRMGPMEFLTAAYARACRVAALKMKKV